MTVKEGDYQIQVHLIEARDLKPSDVDGLSDPLGQVEIMGMKRHTKIHKNTNNVVFDETLFFNFKRVTKEELQSAVIRVTVFDADTIGRNDVIGETELDTLFVYYKKHHEIYNQWVGLTDPRHTSDQGLQGYLKLSVTVIGPGDKPYIHDPADDGKSDANLSTAGLASMLLLPPSIKQETHFLVTNVYKGDGLPAMDSAKLGITKAGLDGYVSIEFAGNKRARTKYHTRKGKEDLTIRWNESIWMPVTTPTMTSAITMAVWDHDLTSPNERIGSVHLDFKDVSRAGATGTGPRWHNVYGPPKGCSGKHTKHMKLFPGDATHYRGRLLVSMREDPDEKDKHPEKNHKKRIKSLRTHLLPKERRFILRALVISGADIPHEHSMMKQVKWGIGVSVGRYRINTTTNTNVHGQVVWREPLETAVQLPVDFGMVPDVFVYLWHGSEGKPKDVCYARMSAASVMSKGFSAPAHWVQLHEDKALDALEDNEEPGSVLMRLGLGMPEEAAANRWADDLADLDRKDRYEVRLHVYQGRELPAADDNGSLDPFVRADFMGETQKTSKLKRSTNPVWYETLVMQVALPPIRFAPQINVSVWDHDTFSGDDRVCRMHLDVSSDLCTVTRPGEPLPTRDTLRDPQWMPLLPFGNVALDELHHMADGSGHVHAMYGELLVQAQLIQLPRPEELPVPFPIVPDMEDHVIEIIALGLRDMAAYQFTPIYLPHVEFDLGDKNRHSVSASTKASKVPSGTNANFVEVTTAWVCCRC